MATLRNKRRLAAVSRETPENTRNIHSQTTLNPGMADKYITQFSEKIEGRVTKKLSQEISRTESRFLGALSKIDDFLLNSQVQNCSVVVPGTSMNNNSENQEPTGDGSLNNPCPEVMYSACHTNNLNDSEQEETHHIVTGIQEEIPYCFPRTSSGKQTKVGALHKSATISQ